MGNGGGKPVEPSKSWDAFQQHVLALNTVIAQNNSFLRAYMKMSELRIEYRLNTEGYMPDFLCRYYFRERTTVSVVYRFHHGKSESGLEDSSFLRYDSADLFMTMSAQLLKVLDEMQVFNRQFREHISKSKTLPESLRKQGVSEMDLNLCGICFERPMDAIMACKHAYCEQCAKDWLQKSDECPMCRQTIKRNSYFL